MKNECQVIISTDAEKPFDKIQHKLKKIFFKLSKMLVYWEHFNIIKAIYDKPTANIILKGEKK